ncbi:APC family permease [Actinoallomurus iriomotensis]|uniref:Amino acid permease n=1 Tax=Actinoallomurus iriomotensis TaxID=478107 RepID=A0A9W6SFB4_9ACTN|nr:amino acid permease [Actinoallomurus iriomotensis]GLY92534.1 amino acid permease [Actinoallomurus iriomotensis]
MTLSTKTGPSVEPGNRLGPAQGTALLVGAVLGPGVLALPHLAAAAAGPAAILAWAALLGLSVPVAITFAALGARFPDGGGVAAFTARAFGPRMAAVVGWWFFAAVPVGVLAGVLIGGDYVASAVGLGHRSAVAVAIGLLVAAFVTNHGGLRVSGRVQLVLVGALVLLLAAAIVAAGPALRPANFTPFAPHGGFGVVHAVGVLFFAFSGWEAASHLSAEFADPRRSLPRATALTLLIVGVLYVGLAVTVTGVLGDRAAASPAPLALLLQEEVGGTARILTGTVAVLLSFVAVNTYIAGGARLGAALARDGALPAPLARGSAAGRVPHRSLLLLAALTALVAAVAVPYGPDLDVLMRVTAACLAAVTLAGMAAAVRLAPRDGRGRTLAAAATAFTALVLLSCGIYLLVPAILAAAVLVTWWRGVETGRRR